MSLTDPQSPDAVRDIMRALDRDLSSAHAQTAIQYARDAELEHPVNRKPAAIAAGAVYAAGLLCNRKVTQPQVAVAADVSEVTVRNSYREVLEYCTDIDTDRMGSDARTGSVGSGAHVFDRLRALF